MGIIFKHSSSLISNFFPWLKFVSIAAKSNIDNSYPLTKYENKMWDFNIIWDICKNILMFPWLWQFFINFPDLFPTFSFQNFSWLFPEFPGFPFRWLSFDKEGHDRILIHLVNTPRALTWKENFHPVLRQWKLKTHFVKPDKSAQVRVWSYKIVKGNNCIIFNVCNILFSYK